MKKLIEVLGDDVAIIYSTQIVKTEEKPTEGNVYPHKNIVNHIYLYRNMFDQYGQNTGVEKIVFDINQLKKIFKEIESVESASFDQIYESDLPF